MEDTLGGSPAVSVCLIRNTNPQSTYTVSVRQLSLALGPVIGGVLAGTAGWRSIFWFLTGFSGLCVISIILALPETLRRLAGNGEVRLHSWIYRPLLWPIIRISAKSSVQDEETRYKPASDEIQPPKPFSVEIFFKPFNLLGEPDTLCALLFGGTVYTAWSMMMASTTYLLKSTYQFSTIQ